ncbi:PEP/pyruvate-binding domain-containing protein [Nonomuraea cavernae]|uniref:Pyruvate, water dikinase n=1 Tax=Nonomuraea cavernae TaxID=2045107 RepID=A0A918DFP8_9ACTN|nr:PEP/pyruvate-binding domain-containing protein [Nonomuraea cavernae]MCA2183978.1 pyruvate, water dikinase [Nonomuraea cavernae]GGO61961.1 hypothetical protein GCM10012289_05440 [Nonomuraea cavernae]
MNVIELARVNASMVELVGGKAAALGELIGAGEAVPAGFCLTTEAHATGVIPEDELVAAYARLGGGPVAVRSSATAEDLPDASFAGQQDTFLGVSGAADLVDAVRACWASLRSERAIAYRKANGIDEDSVSMAVVVQRMVDPEVAGVLFTANPITGTRTQMVVDAAPGLGTAVVDGSADTDHYLLDGCEPTGAHGCLGPRHLTALYDAGQRLQEHFGAPQDVEWAFDRDGALWLLQSRPITTLFPLPPESDRPGPRVYFEFSHMEGMLRPFTPMGMSAFKGVIAGLAAVCGVRVDPIDGPRSVVSVGGRLYVDLTDLVRHRASRERLPEVLRIYGPRAAVAMERLSGDPRFAPLPGRPYRLSTVIRMTLRFAPLITAGIVRALVRPAPARERAFRVAEEARRLAAPPSGFAHGATAAERVRFATGLQRSFVTGGMMRSMSALYAGLLSVRLAARLLKGVTAEGEIETVLRGMPYNVTTEMDLTLWRLAASVGEHRDLLLDTPATELARRYREGELPGIGLEAFLAEYGMRGAAEADVGVPRWAEDPAPLFSAIANYLRLTDPGQAPDRRFARAAREAKQKIDELVRRARRRPVRARLARFFLLRARALSGLRELGKFAWLYPLAEMRRQLLLAGAELAGRGLLDRADDIMFLDLREAGAAAEGTDHRELVASRRAVYERESRRRSVPGLLLSDGTDLEALAPDTPPAEGTLVGLAAAPGTASGPARVILDPAGAHVEPGEILVAPTTDPGWTPLFLTAAGLVTETGSPMAHGPTVAREYGIPAVICVRDATREIHTGDRVTIDGAAGTVTLGP